MAWNCSTHELRQEYKLKGTWATVRAGGEPGLHTETFFQKHFFFKVKMKLELESILK